MARIVQQQTEIEGDETLTLRLWSVDGVGTDDRLTQIQYVRSFEEAAKMVYLDGWGDGANVAELQQFEDGEWVTWWDDRGCSFEECVEEMRESNPDGFNETLQEAFNRLG